jgi:transaldolase
MGRAIDPGCEETILAWGRQSVPVEPRGLVSSSLLTSLREAGTSHIYADTADHEELEAVATAPGGRLVQEIDGATVNQPLVHRVLERYLAGDRVSRSARDLQLNCSGLPHATRLPLFYTIVCGWIGNQLVATFGARRPFETSLQLHMAVTGHPGDARQLGRWLHRMVGSSFVKVPFTPQAPDALLVARDLEQEGIAVNFTSTFSARQVVTAALLANVARTNVFMGRLNQGLGAELLGEHVDLQAQRELARLRRDVGVTTLLIVASMHDWRTFLRVAGCDVFTAPCAVLRDFLGQTEVPPEDVESQLETSYEDRLTVSDDAIQALGWERIARLWRMEPELVQFLLDYRVTDEYRTLQDGEQLWRRFEAAGFGDLFYAPTTVEWETLRRSKLPDLASPLTANLALDTLYTLLADADFDREQDAIDAALARAAAAPVAA